MFPVRFTCIIALADAVDSDGLLYRVDYLPRQVFDRLRRKGYEPAMFEESRALCHGKLLHNVLHAVNLSETVAQEAERRGYEAAVVRSGGDSDMALHYGSARMKGPLRLERDGRILPVMPGSWPLSLPKLRQRKGHYERAA